MMTRAGLIVSLVLVGCQSDELSALPAGPPDIYLEPSQYMFGEIPEGDSSAPAIIMVGNAGGGDLAIDSVRLTGDNRSSFVMANDAATGATIAADGPTLPITLVFAPDGPGTRQAWLEIGSNDPDENPARIPLQGIGATDAAGPVAVCSASPATPVATVDAVTWTGRESFDPDGLALVGYLWRIVEKPAASWTVMPNCSAEADCGPFLPDVQGPYTAELVVQNAIGLTDSCTVTFNASSPSGSPTAVCAVTPEVIHPPFESATWIGTDSHDPENHAITSYAWRLLSKPAGSAVVMPACSSANCGPFTPDIAGTYVGELTVANAIGDTSTCSVDLLAVPGQSLRIEMYWQHAGDDMDLHLLAPGGILGNAKDCYWANCNSAENHVLEWGQPGLEDNPTLDLDDRDGTGPENINIQTPMDATYTVAVHDHPEYIYLSGNAVTVNVYVDGNVVFTKTHTLVGENSERYYCTIEWPSGTVRPL